MYKGKVYGDSELKTKTPEIKNILSHVNRRLDTEDREQWKLLEDI